MKVAKTVFKVNLGILVVFNNLQQILFNTTQLAPQLFSGLGVIPYQLPLSLFEEEYGRWNVWKYSIECGK